MLYGYLNEILKTVQEQSRQFKNFDQENVERFQKDVERVRGLLAEYKIDDQDSFEKSNKLTEITKKNEDLVGADRGNYIRGNRGYN